MIGAAALVVLALALALVVQRLRRPRDGSMQSDQEIGMEWTTTVTGSSAFDSMGVMMQVNPVLLTQWEECLFTTNFIGLFSRRVIGAMISSGDRCEWRASWPPSVQTGWGI
jgi:hypothetical protein